MGEKKGVAQNITVDFTPKEWDILNTAQSILHRELILRGHRDPALWGKTALPYEWAPSLWNDLSHWLRIMKYAPEPGVHIW